MLFQRLPAEISQDGKIGDRRTEAPGKLKLHTDARTVKVGAIDQWLYPKANKIAKSTVESIKDMIDERFAAEGCAVTYTLDT